MTTIRLANHSTFPFRGWKRTTIDSDPPFGAGEHNGTRFVAGRRIGLDVRAVDVWCELDPGEHLTLELDDCQPIDFARGPIPADPMAHFGGPMRVAEQPVELLSVVPDGAGYLVTARRRHGTMLCTYVWAVWYPDQPAWCIGEALTVASHPATDRMGEELLAGVAVTWGDALALTRCVLPGTTLADGQGKACPVPFFWSRHAGATDMASFAAASSGVCAVGVTKLLTTGAPLFPNGFDARAWAAARWPRAVAQLLTWEPPVCGPAPISGSAGEQEDSLLHAGGEALLPSGVGAEHVRYLAAIKLHSERPCNHLEASGDWLRPEAHPSLVFWDGRPHWHTGVSPDRLGKPRQLTAAEANGRWGPDVQHFYQHGLASAARLTGSPLCQQLLRNLCTVYLLQRTDHPAWATSAWESAREWGCEGQFVQDVWMTLEDRAMADRVVARWRSRVERILLPRMVGRDLLVTWNGDPRVNRDGLGAQWWQESFASWSIDETCRVVGPEAGRELALRVATKVLDTAWAWTEGGADFAESEARFLDPELQAIHEAQAGQQSFAEDAAGHWRAQPQGPIDGSANAENPATDSFNHYGMPLCVAVVLRSDHAHTKARAIWQQLRAATAENSHRWMPPLSD